MFDGKEWIAFTFPKHLSKPCIDNIVEDKEGNIWFSMLDISTGMDCLYYHQVLD